MSLRIISILLSISIPLNLMASEILCPNISNKILFEKGLGIFDKPNFIKEEVKPNISYKFTKSSKDVYGVAVFKRKELVVINSKNPCGPVGIPAEEVLTLNKSCEIDFITAPSWGCNSSDPMKLTSETCIKIGNSKEAEKVLAIAVAPGMGGMDPFRGIDFVSINKLLNSDGSSIPNKAPSPVGSEVIAILMCNKYLEHFAPASASKKQTKKIHGSVAPQ